MTPFAHAGGVDEIALLLLMAGTFWLVYRLASRRPPPREEGRDDAAPAPDRREESDDRDPGAGARDSGR